MSKSENLRKKQTLRIIAICIAIVLALVDGVLLGMHIGNKSVPETKSAASNEYEFIPSAVDTPFVTTAVDEAGSANDGGRKFWSWYGYGSHVSWCACFVSWVADKTGYISDGKVPKFAYVPDAVSWYKSHGRFLKSGSTPSAGDIMFFDWEQDGGTDHVGIVTAVVDDVVFSVEGNSSDRCRQKRYHIDDPVIYGYGETSE